MTDARATELAAQLHRGEISRRQFLVGAAAMGMTATAASAMLASGAKAAPAVKPVGLSGSAQTDPGTLVVVDNLASSSWLYLDPAMIYEIQPQTAMQLVYECLYHIPDGYKPGDVATLLAEDFPGMSEDGLTATIKIKTGVKFQNSGNEMTADDWVWSFNRLKNRVGNPSFLFTDFLESITAVDATTLEIKLLAPNAALAAILTSPPFSVVDRKAAEENGGLSDETAAEADTLTDWLNTGNSIGTGPYMLTQWDAAGEIIISKNADYWGDPVNFDQIIFRNVPDTSTQLQLLETGEADIAFVIDPDKVGQVQGNPALQLIEGPSLAHEYLAMHTMAEPGGPLASKEARQAIAHAVDYSGIIDGLLGGGAVRPATIVTLGLLGADEVADMAYQTDIDKANELWAASGAGDTELTFSYGAGGIADGGISLDILAAKLQEDIQRINGVTVKLNPMDPTQRLADFRAGLLQFTISSWAPDYADVHSYADPFGRTGGAAAKRVGYSNPQVDELLDAGIAELDPEGRLDDYVQIQQILIDEVAFLVLYQVSYRVPASAALQGVQPHGIYVLQLRYASKTA